jgi:hypothetical protein
VRRFLPWASFLIHRLLSRLESLAKSAEMLLDIARDTQRMNKGITGRVNDRVNRTHHIDIAHTPGDDLPS